MSKADPFVQAVESKAGEYGVTAGIAGWLILMDKHEMPTNDNVAVVLTILGSPYSPLTYRIAANSIAETLQSVWGNRQRSGQKRVELWSIKAEIEAIGYPYEFRRGVVFAAFFLGATSDMNVDIAQAGLDSLMAYLHEKV